jgi:4,5-dihydroxyphthalate decarboxylase
LSACGHDPGGSHAEELSTEEEGGLPITIAGYSYDRVQALIDGRVPIEGCSVTFQKSKIGELNTHVLSGPQTREVTEIGLHPYMLGVANDGVRGYSLLPIFPLRTFRHKSIFIRTDRGIDRPEDLRGKTIATPGYSSSSLTWIRGMLGLVGRRFGNGLEAGKHDPGRHRSRRGTARARRVGSARIR